MKLLDGKVALITGARRGIGNKVAMKFAEQGADIAFIYAGSSDGVDVTVAALEQFGTRVKAYQGDAADFAQSHAVVEQVVADFGRVDILVNNAGITRDTLMLRMTEQQWDEVINVNLKSAKSVTVSSSITTLGVFA